MARIAGVVVEGVPHHVTQRGNNRQAVFLRDEDRRIYIETLKRHCGEPRGSGRLWAMRRLSQDSRRGLGDACGYGPRDPSRELLRRLHEEVAGFGGCPSQPQAKSEDLIPVERIAAQIYVIRGQSVMLDADLASLYGVKPRTSTRPLPAIRIAFPTTSCFN